MLVNGAFPSSTLEALDALSYSHMADDLQYAVAVVAPYLVVAADRLRYIGADQAELALIKSECDELAERVWFLEDERCKFDERYLVLPEEKTATEAQVVTLNGEVDRLSQQVQDFSMEKAN